MGKLDPIKPISVTVSDGLSIETYGSIYLPVKAPVSQQLLARIQPEDHVRVERGDLIRDQDGCVYVFMSLKIHKRLNVVPSSTGERVIDCYVSLYNRSGLVSLNSLTIWRNSYTLLSACHM